MSEPQTVTGMVLSVMPVGDYDKRVVLLTKENGKITCFARGARRPQSSLLAATNPFAFGCFEVYPGKNAYTLAKASIKNYFRDLTQDLDRVYLGFYFLEFADYYCQENSDEGPMLLLLYKTMQALESQAFEQKLIRAVFEQKALTLCGEGPSVYSCLHCHKKEGLLVFSSRRGGLFCQECGQAAGGRRISDTTRYTLQFVASAKVEKLYSFKLSEDILKEYTGLIEEYTRTYIHHDFKSLGLLDDNL